MKIGVSEGNNVRCALATRTRGENDKQSRNQDRANDARKTDESPSAPPNIDRSQGVQADGSKADFGRMAPHALMGWLRGWAVRIVGIGVIGPHSEVVVHSHNEAG
jgi:hypothetical protein